MINQKQIEIEQIKNLELIYFYNTKSNSYIGLNIVYDNGKNLKYDYTYEYFEEFIAKVITTYKKEKENNKVKFLNKESKDILDSFIMKEFKINKEEQLSDRISKYNNRNIDIIFLNEYIKRTVLLFLRCMRNDENIEITSITGYRDKYVIRYECNNIEYILPIIVIKQDENNYIIRFRYIDDITISFNGNINFYKDCVAINYISYDKNLKGKNIYHIDSNNSEEIIKYYGNIISYDKPDFNVVDNNIIDFYLNLLNLPNINNRVKTVDNNYLLIENIDENTRYYIHLSIYERFVSIIVNKSYGIQNENIFVPLEEEKSITNIILEKDNSLVIETHYLETDISTGSYKRNFLNKFKYQFYEIDSLDLRNTFNILEDKTKKIVK